jgi:methyl-accepting chemotaxis protein
MQRIVPTTTQETAMKISNLKIGTRLGFGFAIILSLSVISTTVGVWNIRKVAVATQHMMETPLAKERIVSDWYVLISTAVARTSFIVKSTDETLARTFADDIAASTRSGSKFQDSLEPLLTSDAEKAMYQSIRALRTQYQKAKEDAMKAKQEGKTEDASRIYNDDFMPNARRYQDQVMGFLSLQRQSIDNTGREIARLYDMSFNLMILLGGLIVALGAVCALLISRSIARPLSAALHVARTVASGDLSSHIEVRSRDETGQLMQALKDMNDSLSKVVGEVRVGTDTIATASSQIAAGNLDLSSRTEEQASSLEETAASMEELTSTVKQNADNARQANALATSASAVAVKGGAVVAQVVDTMESINESAKRIVDIISVIDGIAFQTNILALNAAVEAARAGEQGRGFAVVASEVRSLAQRSASAAKEIKSLISDSVAKTDVGTRLVNQAGVTMNEVVDSIKRVTDVMSEITSASVEQTAGIEQVNQAITQMDEVTQQNAALVEEAAAAAASLQQQAENLSQVVSVFRLDGGQGAASALRAPVSASAAGQRPAVQAPLPMVGTGRPGKIASVTPAMSAISATSGSRIGRAPVTATGEWEQF